jgi:uncharacterized protein with GYD domain
MPTYISLLNWTNKGIENIKESPNRLDAAKQLYKSMGAEIKGFYMAMGQYDMVLIADAPNDETVAKLALALASKGAIHTETLKVFSEADYRKIIGSLP